MRAVSVIAVLAIGANGQLAKLGQQKPSYALRVPPQQAAFLPPPVYQQGLPLEEESFAAGPRTATVANSLAYRKGMAWDSGSQADTKAATSVSNIYGESLAMCDAPGFGAEPCTSTSEICASSSQKGIDDPAKDNFFCLKITDVGANMASESDFSWRGFVYGNIVNSIKCDAVSADVLTEAAAIAANSAAQVRDYGPHNIFPASGDWVKDKGTVKTQGVKGKSARYLAAIREICTVCPAKAASDGGKAALQSKCDAMFPGSTVSAIEAPQGDRAWQLVSGLCFLGSVTAFALFLMKRGGAPAEEAKYDLINE